jgi:signal transduction histidine kinase
VIEQVTGRSVLADPIALAVIQAMVRSLRRDEALASELDEAADEQCHLARLDRFLSDVLDFAWPLYGDLTPVDVAALVWDTAGGVLDSWDGPHVRIAVEPGAGTIATDAERLRGVLARLLANARESLRAAGRTDWVDGIEIGARRVGDGRVRLWVADRGAGIPAADLRRVFEPCLAGGRPAAGFGLAVERTVVEALGGRIWLETRQGQGTRVEIELPAAKHEHERWEEKHEHD